ncbi:vacuolar fusion protein ccz1 [Terramyces sp. JEL0728]|nr:vacuolar fusion protein ccz1 [Terramyces sp. JEL0728]
MKPFETSAQLLYFCIFNPKLQGKSESTEDMLRQVLYFYPPTSPDEISRQVGLAQAMESFTAKFTPSQYHIFKTGKTISILYKTDEFYYLIKVRMAATAYTKSGKKYADYSTSDEAMISLAVKSHARYCLFNDVEEFKNLCRVESTGKGKMLEKVDTDSGPPHNFTNQLETYRQKLESFFTCFIQSIDFRKLELASLEGILGYNFYKSVFSILNKLSTITSTTVTLLYKNALVYSGLERYEHIYDLYDYLVDSESGKYDDLIINQVKTKGEAAISSRVSTFLHSANFQSGPPFTGFLIGPETLDQVEQNVVPKIVYFDKTPHIIITYQLHEILTITFTTKHVELEKFHQLSYYAFLQSCIHELMAPLLNIPEKLSSSMYYYTIKNNNTRNLQVGSSNTKITTKVRKLFLQKNSDVERYVNIDGGWLCVLKDGSRDIVVYVDKEVGLDRIQDELNWFKISLE